MSGETTILLVDDENINHILAKRILSGSYRLLSVYSGNEALRAVNGTDGETPGLVLLDILMPEKDGLETFRDMKEIPALSGVPVVFLTSKEDEETKKQCLEAGADAFISKPFSPEVLKRTIERLLQAGNGAV